MSELVDNLKKIVTTFKADSVLIQQAAERIAELESTREGRLHSLGLNADYEARGIEIEALRRDLALERQKVTSARKAEDEANEIIAKIAKAAECENFADIILARVEAQNQQSNAMTRICEGHIANCRKAENANARLNQNLSLAQNERDDLRGQLTHRSALLHDIADALGAGSRNAVPAKDWYMEKIDERMASRSYRNHLDVIGAAVDRKGLSYKDLADYFRGLDIEGLKRSQETLINVAAQIDNWQHRTGTYACDDVKNPDWAKQCNAVFGLLERKANEAEAELRKLKDRLLEKDVLISQLERCPDTRHMKDLEQVRDQFDRCKNRIATANARWDIKVANPADYVEQLDYLIDEIETWRNRAERRNEAWTKAEATSKSLETLLSLANSNYLEACAHRDASQCELDLAVGAIKRMHAKLIEYRQKTGIWPVDGTFRAKLDDIEWCLSVYVGRAVANQQLHEADTRFIADVRDSLSHEILRRNKQ